MRYYAIKIDGAPAVFPTVSGALVSGAQWSSYLNGATDPGALNIELDIPVGPSHIAMGSAWVRIWGIDLRQIGQAADLNNKAIEVYGGMQRGLPLANPAQSGLLVKGTILPGYGNWVGTDMTIDLTISNAPSTGQPTVDQAANVVHHWPANTPLKDALTSTLKTAFPKFTPQVSISDKLKLPYVDTGFYQTIQQYSSYLNQLTKSILGGTYRGVSLTTQGTKIIAADGTTPQTSAGQIAFTDLVGQPTWIGLNQIQVKTIMRADLNVGGEVTLPQGQVSTGAGSSSQFRSQLSFQGKFLIQEMRHVGNFRQPDGNSWVTIFNMVKM